MSDNNGWPDPARPGVPKNPERRGWHWVVAVDPSVSTENAPWLWSSTNQHWLPPVSVSGAADLAPSRVQWRYLGPCLTPDQVAAAVQAEREACAEVARHVSIPEQASAWEAHGRLWAAMQCAIAIRARGPADALAEALAQAETRGMERAAARIEDADPALAEYIRAAMGGKE